MNPNDSWIPPWIPPLLERTETGGETLFASDLHLGAGPDQGRREAEFLELLETLPGRIGTLILGGDVFEFWWEWEYAAPRRHLEFLRALRKASDAGVRVHAIPGNHDFAMGRLLEESAGAKVHPDGFCLDVGGDRWLAVHGDAIARSDRLERIMRRVLRSRAAQRAWNLLPPDLAFRVAGAVGGASRAAASGPPSNVEEYGDAAELWIARWNLAGVVHGHTHRPLLRRRGAGFHVNNGDWLLGRHVVWISPGRNVRLVDCRKDGHPWLSNT